MKKLVLFAALAVFTMSSAFSQGELRMGAKAGLNLASIGGDAYVTGLSGFDSRTSFHVGLLVEVPINDKFSVQPEVLYSSQGSKNVFGFSGGGSLKLDYVNIPIMGKYHIIEGLSAELGPVIGILVKAEAEDDDFDPNVQTISRAATVDVKDFYKSTDIAIAIGASYRLPMGVFFSLRYNKGVTDINDDPDYSGKNQNNVFQVSAGYSF